MKAAPIRVFKIDRSRKPLRAWTTGASSEPEVALETAHLGPEESEVVVLVLPTTVLVMVTEVLVMLSAWSIWIAMLEV